MKRYIWKRGTAAWAKHQALEEPQVVEAQMRRELALILAGKLTETKSS